MHSLPTVVNRHLLILLPGWRWVLLLSAGVYGGVAGGRRRLFLGCSILAERVWLGWLTPCHTALLVGAAATLPPSLTQSLEETDVLRWCA